MYARYTRNRVGDDSTRYEFQQPEKLFGRSGEGYIFWLLEPKVPKNQEQPYKWHLDVLSELGAHPEFRDSTLVIDLRPKQKRTGLFLYELMDVWGYSAHDWTPIMLRLHGLLVGDDPSSVNEKDFVRKDSEIVRPIYEFLYLNGWVAHGELMGPWTSPPVSSTNAALLYRDALNYFLGRILKATPDVFQP
jgi:hypothetical protein